MKRNAVIAFMVLLPAVAANLQAASMRIEERVVGDNAVYSIFLDDLTVADQVTALSVSILPEPGVEFLNYNATGFGPAPNFPQFGPSADATFTNARLTLYCGPPFYCTSWGMIDGSPEVAPPSGPGGIGYAMSNPGNFLDADDLLLNNVMLPRDAFATVQLLLFGGDGNTIPSGRLEATLAVPEGSSLALFVIGCVAFVPRHRGM